MQVSPEALPQQLRRGLAPIYLVHGEEPLQARECLDAIRAAATGAGYTERVILEGDPEVDWGRVQAEGATLSLFSARRLVEVRPRGARLGEEGARTLADFARSPPSDVLLLVSLGKLDARQRSAAWLEAVTRAGVVVAVRPVGAADLPGWVERRAGRVGLRLTSDAARLLAERVEGNLLACAQELEKLALLHPGQSVDEGQVLASTADSARYDVFDWVDGVVGGDARRAARVLAGLRAEGTEPPLLVWALARELRSLAALAYGLERGESLPRLLDRGRVRDARRPLVGRALQRHRAQALRGAIHWLSEIDQKAKGLLPGSAWDELGRLSLWLAGIDEGVAAPGRR
jgi:DNA polymerase-3 subunit delta